MEQERNKEEHSTISNTSRGRYSSLEIYILTRTLFCEAGIFRYVCHEVSADASLVASAYDVVSDTLISVGASCSVALNSQYDELTLSIRRVSIPTEHSTR